MVARLFLTGLLWVCLIGSTAEFRHHLIVPLEITLAVRPPPNEDVDRIQQHDKTYEVEERIVKVENHCDAGNGNC